MAGKRGKAKMHIIEEREKVSSLASYAGFSVGEKVNYTIGSRTNLVAIISNIESHPLSNRSFVFKLIFEDELLAPHLKEQPVTTPQNLDWIEKVSEVEF